MCTINTTSCTSTLSFLHTFQRLGFRVQTLEVKSRGHIVTFTTLLATIWVSSTPQDNSMIGITSYVGSNKSIPTLMDDQVTLSYCKTLHCPHHICYRREIDAQYNDEAETLGEDLCIISAGFSARVRWLSKQRLSIIWIIWHLKTHYPKARTYILACVLHLIDVPLSVLRILQSIPFQKVSPEDEPTGPAKL